MDGIKPELSRSLGGKSFTRRKWEGRTRGRKSAAAGQLGEGRGGLGDEDAAQFAQLRLGEPVGHEVLPRATEARLEVGEEPRHHPGG